MEDYSQWLKLVEYENAILYKHGSLQGSKNRIESYGDIRKFFDEGKSPEEVAQILFEHLSVEIEKKEKKDKESRERMNARRRKFMEDLDARVEGRKGEKKERKELSLEYQLGMYVGDYIAMQYLPSLSVDMCYTKEVVEVSVEDAAKHAELYNIYWTKKDSTNEECKEEWKNYRDFAHLLEEKYLPAVLECSIHKISSIKNMDEFIKGIRNALWNSDICCYNLDTIKVNDEDSKFFTEIIIPLR